MTMDDFDFDIFYELLRLQSAFLRVKEHYNYYHLGGTELYPLLGKAEDYIEKATDIFKKVYNDMINLDID